jgi:hypothetical protein
MQAYEEAIDRLKKGHGKAHGWAESFEFHFAKSNHKQRTAFFEAIRSLQFVAVVCSFDKDAFGRSELTKDRIRELVASEIASQLAGKYLVAEAARGRFEAEVVIYDECQDPSFEKCLRNAFRSWMSRIRADRPLVKKFKPCKSKVSLCLQLADMICGAVAWHLDGKDSCYYRMLEVDRIGILCIGKENDRAEDQQDPPP